MTSLIAAVSSKEMSMYCKTFSYVRPLHWGSISE